MRYAWLVAAAAVLAACSTPEPPPPKAPKIVKRDWVNEIRAQAKSLATAVIVDPLPDPALTDLKALATEQEAKQQYGEAHATIDRAIAIRPEDPGLYQWQAELALQQSKYAEAEALASKSYEMGPKLGEICARNWLTIHAARVEMKQAENAASANAQVAGCQVAAPVRM